MAMPEDDVPESTNPAPVPPAEMERRAFVRRMTGDTVGLAGRVFGLSKAMTRGAVAAGQAVRDNMQAVALEPGAVEPGAATAGAVEPAAETSPEVASEIAAPIDAVPRPETEPERASAPLPPPPTPAVQITDEQAVVLMAARSAVLAVNGRGTPPLAQPVAVHWDGETLRFASLGWSRRATSVQMDPRVTLVVEAPDGEGFVILEGIATLETGEAARDAMAPLLARHGDQADVDRRWAELVTTDPDRLVVLVRPTKVLTGRRS